MPYLYLLLALVTGGMMGVMTKVSEVNRCNPVASTAALFSWGAALTAFQSLVIDSSSLSVPLFVAVTGVVFGSMAGIAFVAFLSGIKYGKITPSWLVTALSPIVPSVASYVVYKEPFVATKVVSLLLILLALAFLFIDKREEEERNLVSAAQPHEAGKSDLIKWARLMAVVFLTASMATFGLKILAEEGLSASFRSRFLFYWYAGGFVFAAVMLLAAKLPVRPREVIIGLLIALSSVLSMVFLSLALEHRVPGYVAFLASGIGSVLVVAAAGRLVFREKLTGYGYAGLVVGCFAVALLSL